MRVLPQFQIPEGVVELSDEYQKNLVHYELLHLKPKGSILFSGESKELKFQFSVTDNREDGVFAKLDEASTPSIRRLFDYLSKYPRTESYATITLLQFRLMFISAKVQLVPGAKVPTLSFKFPEKFLKMHRRKYIRIPFNENFPAELRFQTPFGLKVRSLKDISREGLRLKIEDEDLKVLTPAVRLKGATLKLINREIPIGVQLIAIYPGSQAGFKIIAMTEEDRLWLRDAIRLMIKQMLNLPETAEVDDQLEKDEDGSEKPDGT